MKLLHAPLLVVTLSTGCGGADARPPEEHLGVRHEERVLLEGRHFELVVMDGATKTAAETPPRILAITGDERRISFHVGGTPERPSIVGSTIRFGAHSFTVTKIPGEYLVDDQPVLLPAAPREVHLFSDGTYHGVHRF